MLNMWQKYASQRIGLERRDERGPLFSGVSPYIRLYPFTISRQIRHSNPCRRGCVLRVRHTPALPILGNLAYYHNVWSTTPKFGVVKHVREERVCGWIWPRNLRGRSTSGEAPSNFLEPKRVKRRQFSPKLHVQSSFAQHCCILINMLICLQQKHDDPDTWSQGINNAGARSDCCSY